MYTNSWLENIRLRPCFFFFPVFMSLSPVRRLSYCMFRQKIKYAVLPFG